MVSFRLSSETPDTRIAGSRGPSPDPQSDTGGVALRLNAISLGGRITLARCPAPASVLLTLMAHWQ